MKLYILSTEYQENQEFQEIQDMDRTLESAQAMLAGFFQLPSMAIKTTVYSAGSDVIIMNT